MSFYDMRMNYTTRGLLVVAVAFLSGCGLHGTRPATSPELYGMITNGMPRSEVESISGPSFMTTTNADGTITCDYGFQPLFPVHPSGPTITNGAVVVYRDSRVILKQPVVMSVHRQ